MNFLSISTRTHERTNLRYVLLFVVGLALTTGCGRAVSRVSSNVASSAAGAVVDRVIAQPSSTVELLESELRWMEDNLYRIDDQLETALLELESARRDNAMLRLELAEARGDNRQRAHPQAIYSEPNLHDLSPPVVIDQPMANPSHPIVQPMQTETVGPQTFSGPPANAVPTPAPATGSPAMQRSAGGFDEETRELGDDDPYNIINLGTPTAAPPNPNAAEETETPATEPTPDPALNGPTPTEQLPDGSEGNPFGDDPIELEPEPERPNSVKRIQLNPRLTGGYNFDDIPGHEGVMVVIEPQDAFGRYVPASGEVVVEVIDPAQRGLAGRVAKWKFDSMDARRHLKTSALGKGVHLQLPWPSAPPRNRKLKLNVSYQLANGRTFNAEKNLVVRLPTSVLVQQGSAVDKNWSPERPTMTQTSTSEKVEVTAQRGTSYWAPDR